MNDNYQNWVTKNSVKTCARGEDGVYRPVHIEESVFKYVSESDFVAALPLSVKASNIKQKAPLWSIETYVEAYCRFMGFGGYEKQKSKDIAALLNMAPGLTYSRISGMRVSPNYMLDHVILMCTYKRKKYRVIGQYHWGLTLKGSEGLIDEVAPFTCTKFHTESVDPYEHITDRVGVTDYITKVISFVEGKQNTKVTNNVIPLN